MTDSQMKAFIMRRIGIINGYLYDTDVEPPVTSGEKTTVKLRIHILCAEIPESEGGTVRISGWLAMVSMTS